MTIDDSFRLLSYACSPVITIAALYGLKQLTVSRSIARMHAKRESYRLSVEQCRFYSEVIIPLQNKLDAKSAEARKAMKENANIEVSAKGYRVTFKTKPNLDPFFSFAEEFTDVFNRLDSFAMYFTSGIAEERPAFNSVGASYCRTIKSYAPYIAILSEGKVDDMMKLFLMWNARLDEEKLIKERMELEKRIQSVKGKEIVTIGSKDFD